MDRVIVIPVDELTSATVTRARGAEAFESLMRRLEDIRPRACTVLVDVSHARLLSGSFLDELVARMSKRVPDISPKIGFLVGSQEEVARLERVCSLRRVECIYQYGANAGLKKTRIRRRSNRQIEEYPGPFFELSDR